MIKYHMKMFDFHIEVQYEICYDHIDGGVDMQYDSIILEIISRIKQLETRCDKIEDHISQLELSCYEIHQAILNQNTEVSEEMTVQNGGQKQKMTREMIDACYHCGVALFQQEGIDLGKEIDRLTINTGVNRNSAIMYVYAVKNMLSGQVYKRAISQTATELFFQYILRDFGKEMLKKAVSATRSHITYRRECGHIVDGLEALCNQYEKSY